MSESDRNAVREEIAKLIAHGLEDTEIAQYIMVQKYVLIGIIRDLMTVPVEG